MKTLGVTTPLTRNPDVRAAQQKLAAAGFFDGELDGVFGEQTARACRRAHFWLGFAGKLENAPSYGDKLDAMLDLLLNHDPLPHPNDLNRKDRVKARKQTPPRAKALAESLKHLGVKEKPAGSNHNPFGIWYGLDHAPWCAMFVSYCYVQAGSKAFKKGSHYSYVPYIVHDARAGVNSLAVTTDPQPGDVVCYDWQRDGTADHVGLFEKWTDRSKGAFTAIEGNTGIGNDSNGGEVMRRERTTSLVQAFVHVGR